ncbi:MAG: non-canonical purine NTP pyrophosphatase [Thermoleophilaceae bacterium]
MKLVLASRNTHKVRELSELMAPHVVVPLPGAVELPPETGKAFEDNALGKARGGADTLDAVAIADDSGIEAAALGAGPGVRSARFAGEGATDQENLDKLLGEVAAEGDTRVAYVCALVAVWPDGRELVREARCEGRLTHEPRGAGGFGYDPVFVPDDYDDGRTMAELSAREKDAISHRGRAARALLAALGD